MRALRMPVAFQLTFPEDAAKIYFYAFCGLAEAVVL